MENKGIDLVNSYKFVLLRTSCEIAILYNVYLNFNENGQITEAKKENHKIYFKDWELNLEALKGQEIKVFW